MRLSLAFEMQRPVLDDHAVIEDTLQQCILADEVGFDAVWFVEHHFLTSFSMSPCPEVMFGALSRQTKRLRLGFGVVILPYHHPVRVAERVNDQWLSSVMGLCGEDDEETRDLCALSLKTFFGPDKPYLQDQKDVYENLLKQWGGVPEHLQNNFARYLKPAADPDSGATVDLSGGTTSARQAVLDIEGSTLRERGVLVAGNPEECIKGIKLHEQA